MTTQPFRLNISIPSRWPANLRHATFKLLTESAAGPVFESVRESASLAPTEVLVLEGARSKLAARRKSRAQAPRSLDSYEWKREGQAILIQGANPRSAAFGLFEIARLRGMRWLTPMRDVQYVSEWAERIPDRYRWQAAFPTRSWYIEGDPGAFTVLKRIEDLCGFLLFHHWNTLSMNTRGGPELIKLVQSFGLKSELGGHILRHVMPREHFAEHPDYFPIVRGARTPEPGDFSLGNPEAEAIIRRNAVSFFRKVASAEGLHFWYDDVWFGAEDESTPSDWSATRRTAEALRLVSGLHRRLAPRQRLITLAYNKQLFPDPKVRFDPNVDILFCPRERCTIHPLSGPQACARNREYTGLLRAWVNAVGPSRLRYLDYSIDHYLRVSSWLIHPSMEVQARDIQFLASLKLLGISTVYFSEFSDVEGALALSGLAQLVARPQECLPARIREEYFHLAFGERAAKAKKLFTLFAPLQAEYLRYDDYLGRKRDIRFPGLDQTEPSLRHSERLRRALATYSGPLRRALDDCPPSTDVTPSGRALFRLIQNLRFSLGNFSLTVHMLKGVPYIRGERKRPPFREAWKKARTELKTLRAEVEKIHSNPYAAGIWSSAFLTGWSVQMERCLQFGQVTERD